MQSFLEFVSRCITTPEVSTNGEVLTAATPSKTEETRSLMSPKVAAQRKKKRVRVGIAGSMNQEWKPSLLVISEDNTMAEKKGKTPPKLTKAADKVEKRKSTTGSRSRVHVRSHSDDIGRNLVPVVIPAFSPTPFVI